MKAIEECVPLAPLHNPPNIIGIRACQAAMKGVPQIAGVRYGLSSDDAQRSVHVCAAV